MVKIVKTFIIDILLIIVFFTVCSCENDNSYTGVYKATSVIISGKTITIDDDSDFNEETLKLIIQEEGIAYLLVDNMEIYLLAWKENADDIIILYYNGNAVATCVFRGKQITAVYKEMNFTGIRDEK